MGILLINRKAESVAFTQSLYGLKQSPRAWNEALDTSQINGFKTY
jgi:hypothetical protein